MVLLALPEPPINITPAGESQLEWPYLIMIIIINTELTRTVRDISDNYLIPLIVYIYQSDYLFSSSVVVTSQPASVRVRQDVPVSLL